MVAGEQNPESGRSALWRAGPGLFSVLRHRDFRYVWSSQMLHLWGNEMENLVLAWFVLVETDSPLLVGLIGAVRFGGTLLAPYYGAVVDRFDRRNIQVFSQALSVVLASTLMTLVLTDVFVTWHAFVIVSLSSFASTLGIVANQALSADTVPSKQLNSAMGLNRATIDFARITGSLLGGGLMSALGLGPAYIGVVALYVASTLAAALISRQGTLHTNGEGGSEEQAGYLKHISQGVGYVREHSILAGLLFFAFLIEFTTFPLVNELMTVLGEELFDADENGIGIMRAVASGGALLGALITGAAPTIANPSRLLLISVTIWHLLTVPLVIDVSLGAVLPILFVWGIFAGISFVALMVGLLRLTNIGMRGRVMGLRALAVYGLPMGLLMGGWLAEEFGATTMVITHGLLGLGLTLVAAAVWPSLWRGVESSGVAAATGPDPEVGK